MRWSHSTARQRLSNEVYLGVVRAGTYRTEDAHPAIIEHHLWDVVQAAHTPSPAAPGVLTADRLLQGIARCAGCGKTLEVLHRKRVNGSRVSAYFCKNAATEECPDRAHVHCDVLEDYVCDVFSASLRSTPRLVDVVEVGRELDAAQKALEAAQVELDAFVDNGEARRGRAPPAFSRLRAARRSAQVRRRRAILGVGASMTSAPY